MGTGEICRLVSTGRREVSGIQIDRFAPGVIRFKSEPAADALRQRDIQPMVVRGTLIDPLSAVTHVGVRPVTRRMDNVPFGTRSLLRGGAGFSAPHPVAPFGSI